MQRNSFIQMSKLSNVRGRITYISSHAKQENLYAVYETTDRHFWTELAKFNQQEFVKSGTEGKCIEAREFIIALPESFPNLYDSYRLLMHFVDRFQEKYGVECIGALHHNKRKTNYHIHLIFSERELLEEPIEKVATRNMFYDEKGKHCRTKKEILDEAGNVRKGCKIVKKGEVYERIPFTKKNPLFKQENFVDEVKHFFTDLINVLVRNDEKKLHVFDRNSLYLPTKKVGKNNPKAAQIQEDNVIRMEWNMEVDRALVSEVPEEEIRKIKKEYITDRIKLSIEAWGDNHPELLGKIIGRAIMALALLISKVMQKARELKERLFATVNVAVDQEKINPDRETVRAEVELVEEVVVEEIIQVSTISEIEAPEPVVSKSDVYVGGLADIGVEDMAMDPVVMTESEIPPKPEMSLEARAYPRLLKIDAELKRQNSIIFDVEHERMLLEVERDDLKGLAKLGRKGELQKQIERKNEEAEILKRGLSGIVKKYGYANVQDFHNALYVARDAYLDYREKLSKWEADYGKMLEAKAETVSEKLQRYQERKGSFASNQRDRGAR